MSTALRPVLRTPQLLPSSSTTSSVRKPSPSYICASCQNHQQQSRSAHLLRRPKRPYTFTQLVTLSDGSAFTMRTTSPHPVYRSTRDTRNAPLWNPSSKELTNMEDDEAGRLAKFRERYGRSFDALKGSEAAVAEADAEAAAMPEMVGSSSSDSEQVAAGEGGQEVTKGAATEAGKGTVTKVMKAPLRIQSDEIDDGWDFGDEDANMLDLISSYGQEDIKQQDAPKVKKGKK